MQLSSTYYNKTAEIATNENIINLPALPGTSCLLLGNSNYSAPLQVLLVGLVSIKVSDRIFEFVASRINSTLLSKAYKDAEYIDIHEGEVGGASI